MKQPDTGPRHLDAGAIADDIDQRIRALPVQSTEPIRHIRREYSRRLRTASATDVLAIAEALVDRQRWVAYEPDEVIHG